MIRAEAKIALSKWREALVGLAVMALGLYWAMSFFGILKWVGVVVIPIGGALVYIGVQRARFRQNSDGPGIVAVVEGQISYFGPIAGGVVAVEDIARISLVTKADKSEWCIEQPAQPALNIPTNARGAEALFDIFAMLPGLNIEHMVKKLSQKDAQPALIWQRDSYLEVNRYLQ